MSHWQQPPARVRGQPCRAFAESGGHSYSLVRDDVNRNRRPVAAASAPRGVDPKIPVATSAFGFRTDVERRSFRIESGRLRRGV
jgi:hypothetical protein